jgi:hypothetical protein
MFSLNPLSYVLGGGLLLALIFGGVQTIRLYDMRAQRDHLQASIEDPVTGWAARHAQCETNVASLDTSIKGLNGQVEKLAADTKSGNERNAVLMGTAIINLRGVRASTDKLLAMPAMAPVGSIEACRAGARILRGSVGMP